MRKPIILAYYLPQFHPIPEKQRQEMSDLGNASILHPVNKHLSAVDGPSDDHSSTITDGRTMVERWSNDGRTEEVDTAPDGRMKMV